MITKFDSSYYGTVDMENLGYAGTPINERRYSQAELGGALHKCPLAYFSFRRLSERAHRAINSPARFPYSTGYVAGLSGSGNHVAAGSLSWPKAPPVSCTRAASFNQ